MRRAKAIWLRGIVETAAQSLEDATAVQVKGLFPEWADTVGGTLALGQRVRHGGKLWRVRQTHTAQVQWEPGVTGTESLYEEVNETHAGTQEDPIPYGGNMALVSGLYYRQGGVTYLCTRDTGEAVYHALSELVGLYVEVVG